MAYSSEVRTLSVSIDRPATEVYNFIANPLNFPQWASGLCKSIKKIDNDWWQIEAPEGLMRARFTAWNPYGVVDHHVEAAPGHEIYIPMRVLHNGDRSELTFTLFRLDGMNDEKFESDSQWVESDLVAIKRLLESR